MSEIPRLLYIGDVPVESSYHGSALLYRLLDKYPSDLVSIVEGGIEASLPVRRLKGVEYSSRLQPARRWLNTRFHRVVASALTVLAPGRARTITSGSTAGTIQAVLTVAHGYSWLTAARFAEQLHLPLHLIVHDDWPHIPRLQKWADRWMKERFARTYRQAASRLCVSPYMEEAYRDEYGIEGKVLLPSRAAGAPCHQAPPTRPQSRPLTVAFGGTLNTSGHVSSLQLLAERLAPLGGVLQVYGPTTQLQAHKAGLSATNVHFQGLVPSDRFIETVRQSADALFVPMSFESQDRRNMSLCFPSKLTDYTAAALPLIIHGPNYSSAVRWASDNAGVAEVLTTQDPTEMDIVLQRIAHSEHRIALARRAVEVGEAQFSHSVGYRTLLESLCE